jgi:predicted peptidase
MMAVAAQGGAGAAAAAPASTPAKGSVNVPAQAERAAATYPYRLVEPSAAALKAEKSGRLPLVVFLHGSGERGADNEAQLKHFAGEAATEAFQAKHPCFVLAVQCPADERWADITRGADGNPNWGAGLQTKAEPTRALRAVELALDEVMRTKPVDVDRVYLTGLSMGGFGSFDLAVREPGRFAALVSVCGGGDPARAEALRALPVMVAHGIDDPVVPIACSRAMAEAIRAAGGSVTVREYPGVGHDAWTRAYTDADDGVLAWMFAQRRRGKQ